MDDKWKTILMDVLKVIAVLLVIIFFFMMSIPQTTVKPVIYLYPEQEMEARVEIAYRGELTVLYPTGNVQRNVTTTVAETKDKQIRDIVSWNVTARPDGTLTDHADGREYSYLFWGG